MAHVRSCGLSLLCALSCALLCALGFSDPVSAQDADRIWGQVHTKSGEVHEGFGRACWNSHTDEMLTALFPLPMETREGGE